MIVLNFSNKRLKVIDYKETMTSSPKSVKITVVGDSRVGKTGLLFTYTMNEFPIGNIPMVFTDYPKHITVDGQLYNLALCDTLAPEVYEKLRPLLYPNTTCFLVCYSVCGWVSYENVAKKWVSEVRHHMPHTPIILVATKIDLRDDPNRMTISEKEGKKLKRRIKADAFIECSAKNVINLSEVFEEAVRCSVKQNTSHAARTCTII